MSEAKSLSRRDFLKLTGLLLVERTLTACESGLKQVKFEGSRVKETAYSGDDPILKGEKLIDEQFLSQMLEFMGNSEVPLVEKTAESIQNLRNVKAGDYPTDWPEHLKLFLDLSYWPMPITYSLTDNVSRATFLQVWDESKSVCVKSSLNEHCNGHPIKEKSLQFGIHLGTGRVKNFGVRAESLYLLKEYLTIQLGIQAGWEMWSVADKYGLVNKVNFSDGRLIKDEKTQKLIGMGMLLNEMAEKQKSDVWLMIDVLPAIQTAMLMGLMVEKGTMLQGEVVATGTFNELQKEIKSSGNWREWQRKYIDSWGKKEFLPPLNAWETMVTDRDLYLYIKEKSETIYE